MPGVSLAPTPNHPNHGCALRYLPPNPNRHRNPLEVVARHMRLRGRPAGHQLGRQRLRPDVLTVRSHHPRNLRVAGNALSRSINAQAEHWMRVGMLTEMNPGLDHREICQMLVRAELAGGLDIAAAVADPPPRGKPRARPAAGKPRP